MVSRDSGKLVLWPHYFDKNLSRAQGRRVSQDLAVEEPKAHGILQAARTLGLKPELEEDARPPLSWAGGKGRVIIPKPKEAKESVLRQIARRL